MASDSGLSSLLSSSSSAPASSRSCSPLSFLSRSPSPPPAAMMRPRIPSMPYPSPPASQQHSQNGSPAPDGDMAADKDGPPPAKRRRISGKTERTTEHLDLRSDTVHPDQQRQLDRLVNVLHRRQKIVVIAGAGISVSAGIPDFRSSQGLFRTLKEEYNLKGSGKDLFDASVYKDDASTSSFHDMVNTMSRLTKDAKPTAFHHMLATIAQEDRLLRLYSQNVDGIDTGLEPLKTSIPLAKGTDGKWPRTVQVHGGLDKMVCSKCHDLADLEPTLFDGPVPPTCTRCVEVNDIRVGVEGKRSHGIGRMRPRMVLYNEHNPDDEAIGAVTKDDLRKRPDAVIVVGTTLKVPGVRRIVREMCATVRDRKGGVAIWINSDPPPITKDLEDCWDIIVQGPCDNVAKHAAMRRWDEPATSEVYSEVSEGEAKKTTAKSLRVHLPPKHQQPQYAPKMAPETSLHRNNSFKPLALGETTPRKCMEQGPMDWSPLGTPQLSVMQSIEQSVQADHSIPNMVHSVHQPHGMPTPSESESTRSSPAKSNILHIASFPNLKGSNTELARARQPANGTKKAASTQGKKQPGVSQIPATKPKAKKTGKVASTASTRPATKAPRKANRRASLKTTLKSSMGVSKATVDAVPKHEKDQDVHHQADKSASKVTEASCAPSEPMQALSASPQDPRSAQPYGSDSSTAHVHNPGLVF